MDHTAYRLIGCHKILPAIIKLTDGKLRLILFYYPILLYTMQPTYDQFIPSHSQVDIDFALLTFGLNEVKIQNLHNH